MTREEHTKKHMELHKAFDELLADYINHEKRLPSQITALELMTWSYRQTIEPDPDNT
jgi:hypothetical protein